MNAGRQLTFEGFCLDVANERLLRDGKVVALAPKAFTVLRCLVEHSGELVMKSELLRAGWSDTHVSDGVLKVNILEIRRALDDDSTAPRFIEAVPRRGYRFIARCGREVPIASSADAPGTLVGREGTLAQLHAKLESALTGRRHLVLLSGEAGIGKTAALDAFTAGAASNPELLIARGACLEHHGAAEPYLPVLDALARLLRAPGNQRLIRLLRTYAPTWLAQLPWVEPVDAAYPPPEAVGVARERMLREMTDAVDTLTATTPLLFVLEDLHWSDCSTIDLLGMLTRRQDPARLLIVGSYRPVESAKTDPVRTLVQDTHMRGHCDDIALTFLSESDVSAYLTHRFGTHAFPASLARLVHERTDGNPLFMVRVVDELVALETLQLENGRWRLKKRVSDIVRSVPSSLRALIDMQVDRMEPEAQQLLEAASVLGSEFSGASIAAGLRSDAAAVEDRCDALVRQGRFFAATDPLPRPDGTMLSRYRFTHSLYPPAIAERVPSSWRRRLHERVAEWLESTSGAQASLVASALAWHFEQSGNLARAIRYLVLTAENAARRFAYADVIRVLEQARALVRRLPVDQQSTYDIELLQRIGDAHYGRGAWIECAKAFEAALTRAMDAEPTATRIHALRGLVRPFAILDPNRSIAAIEQAVRLSISVGDPLLQARTEFLAAAIRLTYDAWRTEDWDVCATRYATIRQSSSDGPPAFDRVTYAHVQAMRGDYRGALESLDIEMPQGGAATSIMEPMYTLSARALALLHTGRLGELLQLLRAGKHTAEANGDEPWLFVSREAWLRTTILDFAGARALCTAMAARSTARHWRGPSMSIGAVAAGCDALQDGDNENAARSFRLVLDGKNVPKFFLHWYWLMSAQLGLSNAWLAAGDLLKARAEADRFSDSAFSTAEPNLHALAWDLRARLGLAEKEWKTAADDSEKALAVVAAYEIPTTAWRVHATRSQLHRHAKDSVAAEEQRARAEAIVLTLADSLGPDEPLRRSFLGAAPIRRIRRKPAGLPAHF